MTGSSTLASLDPACVTDTEKLGPAVKSKFDFKLFYDQLNLLKQGNLPRTQKGALPYDGVLDFKTPEEFLAILEHYSADGRFEGWGLKDFIEQASLKDLVKLRRAVRTLVNSEFVTEGQITKVLARIYRIMHPTTRIFSAFKNYNSLKEYMAGMPDDYLEQRIEFAVAHNSIQNVFFELGFIRDGGAFRRLVDPGSNSQSPLRSSLYIYGAIATVIHGYLPFVPQFDFLAEKISSPENIDLVVEKGIEEALVILQAKYGKQVMTQFGVGLLRKVYLSAALTSILIVGSQNAKIEQAKADQAVQRDAVETAETLNSLKAMDKKIKTPQEQTDSFYKKFIEEMQARHPDQKIDPNSPQMKAIYKTIHDAAVEAQTGSE